MTYFGTDGVRGRSNTPPIEPQTILRLALATALVFRGGRHRQRVVISKDTRLSGYMLEHAMTAGFTAMGFDVLLVGPLPTPAVSMLVRSMRADVGVMISASHNPYDDNGVKIFDSNGHKLSDHQEQDITAKMDGLFPLVPPNSIGRARRYEDARGRYIEFLKNRFPAGQTLDGIKVVVDCANGAAYRIAPAVLGELGAKVCTIGDSPNGMNINAECGATAPELLSRTVVKEGADIGIALDGDADRLVIIDNHGQPISGEHLLGLIAINLHDRGRLQGAVISTIQANMGLESYLNHHGIDLLRVGVGDRKITHAMRECGSNLGGEPSGHLIFGDLHPTGDGIMAALQVLAFLAESGKPDISHTGRPFSLIPQKSLNISVSNQKEAQSVVDSPALRQHLETLRQAMHPHGRLLVRASGTEPLIRVMVESQDPQQLDQAAQSAIAKINEMLLSASDADAKTDCAPAKKIAAE